MYRALSSAIAESKRRRSHRLGRDIKVISVGNITVGGNGKTPFAIWALKSLVERGLAAAYVSRGYGGIAEKCPGLTIVPPRGREGSVPPSCRVVSRDHRYLAAQTSDEAAVVAASEPGVPLVLGRDKRAAVEVACEVFGSAVAVVDDAFQSWSLQRDLDVVMLDYRHPLGNGRVLPAGPLREGRGALRRAQVVVVNGADNEHEVAAVAGLFGGYGACWCGLRRSVALSGGTIPGGRVATLTAIARPADFEDDVRRLGLEPVLALRYPDHHRYGDRDRARIESLCARERITDLVVTEKDWVKLGGLELSPVSVHVVRLRVEVIGPDPFASLEF